MAAETMGCGTFARKEAVFLLLSNRNGDDDNDDYKNDDDDADNDCDGEDYGDRG